MTTIWTIIVCTFCIVAYKEAGIRGIIGLSIGVLLVDLLVKFI
jgi:hypothetical protein